MTIINDPQSEVQPVHQFHLESRDPTVLATLTAALRMENSVASAIASGPSAEPVENYDPFDEIAGYEAHADRFVQSNSPADTERIKQNIRREMKDREILHDSGGFGVAASIGAGILDPMFLPAMFIPGTAIVRGERVRNVAFKSAVAGAGGAAITEIPLQFTQETRTGQESVIAIGGSALFSGLFGTGVSAFTARELSRAEKAINSDIAEIVTGESVGAALARKTTLEQEKMVSSLGAAEALKQINPLLRTSQSPSKTTRQTVQDLVENGFITEKNFERIRTPSAVETVIKQHDARLAFAVENLDSEFVKYRTGLAGSRWGRIKLSVRDTLRPSDKLSFTEFKAQVAYSLRRNDQHPIPEVAATAQHYRKTVFDPLKDAAIANKLLPENVKAVGADSYLTRIYRWPKIKADRQKFTNILTNWFENQHKLTPEEARLIAEDVINNIGRTPAGHIPKDIVPKAGPLKDRVLDIPDEQIEEFLENDIEVIASHYIHTMAPEVELVRRFGRKDMADQVQAIVDEYGVLLDKAETPKQRTKLSNQMDQDIKDLHAMRDRLLGTYGQPNDPGSFIVSAGRTVRDYNFLRLLGGMTVSAIPDAARPMMRHGFRAYAKAARQLATSSHDAKLLRRELKAMGIGLDMTLNSRAKAIAEIGEVSQFSGAVGRVSRNLSTNFGIVSAMAPWNAAWKQFSGIMASNEIIHQAGRLASGTIGKKNLAKLAQAGIDEDFANRITAQIQKHGDVGDVTLPHAHLWDDREAAEVFTTAILKDVDLSIVTPGVGDRPLWMSSEMGKVAGQFKSFQFASTNRVMIAGLQARDAAAMSGALLTLGLGAMVYGAKQKLAGREVSRDPQVIITEAIDRSGMTGILFDVNNITEKFTRGTVGVSALTGGPTMSRYQSRNVMGALFGPTADLIPDVTQVSGAVSTGEVTGSDIHTARKLVPYQNLFYLRWLFDQAEEGAKDALNVEQ